MQTTHPNWWRWTKPQWICTLFFLFVLGLPFAEHPLCAGTPPKNSLCWVQFFVFGTADVTHRHFHHPTFLPKVSPKPRLRSFRETISCWQSVGTSNWRHHGCQSWTLWCVRWMASNMISELKGSCQKSARKSDGPLLLPMSHGKAVNAGYMLF